jgi:hypothetical protein
MMTPDQDSFSTAEVAKLDESCERLVNRLFCKRRRESVALGGVGGR